MDPSGVRWRICIPVLAETRDWNDLACLADFVWSRAHPNAPRKLPNRFSREI